MLGCLFVVAFMCEMTLVSHNGMNKVFCTCLRFASVSVPSSKCDAAPEATADAAAPGHRPAARPLPLPQHQTGQ